MYSLKDKVALVTGGANGIGANIVKEFLREDIKFVAIVDIDEVSGVNLKNAMKAEYKSDKVDFFKCDITIDDELHRIFEKIVEEFGAVDVVVNNAGLSKDTMDLYKKEIEVNFTATVSLTLKALESMRADRGGKGGTIINVSSIGALSLMSPSIFIYSATKIAVLHLSVCMGMEEYYRHTNVRIIVMCFGVTQTKMLKSAECVDEIANLTLKKNIAAMEEQTRIQSATIAAQGVVQSYRTGKSGSTWLVDSSKIIDITDRIHEAFKIMSQDFNFS